MLVISNLFEILVDRFTYFLQLDSGKRKAAIKLRSTLKRNALTELFRRLKQEGKGIGACIIKCEQLLCIMAAVGLSYRKTAGADDLHVSAFSIPSLQHLHM